MFGRGRNSSQRLIASQADRALSRALAILVIAVLVPTALLLFFAVVAMRNEQLAARQQLLDFQSEHLRKLHADLVATIDTWTESLDALDSSATPAGSFQQLVESGQFESALVFGPDGSVAYPVVEPEHDFQVESNAALARFARQQLAGWLKGAGALVNLAPSAESPDRGYQVRRTVKALHRRGDHRAAVQLIASEFIAGPLAHTTDDEGRSMTVGACLASLASLPSDPEYQSERAALSRALKEQAMDYEHPLPEAQRRHALRELGALAPDAEVQRWLRAGALAGQLADLHRPQGSGAQWIEHGGQQFLVAPSRDGRVEGVSSLAYVTEQLQQQVAAAAVSPQARLEIITPRERKSASNQPLLAEPLSGWLDGWRLAVFADSDQGLASRARQRTLLYGWTTALAIVAVGAMGSWASIALRKQLRLTQLKNDLLSIISHELKTPVAAIRVLVDTLLAGNYSPEQTREYLELVGRENRRLDRLVQSFLSYGRIQRQQLSLRREPLRMADVVDEALRTLGESCHGDKCQLTIDLPDELPTVDGDRDALVTVIANLLDNAVKYTPQDKRIEVSARAREGRLDLHVRDNGLGFPASAANRIFEPFYQQDRSLARSAEGFGLGLSIARGLAEAHGGTLTARGMPGGGSEFTLSLPMSDRAPHVEEPQPKDESCAPAC